MTPKYDWSLISYNKEFLSSKKNDVIRITITELKRLTFDKKKSDEFVTRFFNLIIHFGPYY